MNIQMYFPGIRLKRIEYLDIVTEQISTGKE